MSKATYMPADPDLWGEHEDRMANPVATLRDYLNEFQARQRQISALLVARPDLIETVGGVTATCLVMVFNAMDAAVHEPGGGERLADLYEAMHGVEEWHEAGGNEDQEEA